MRTFFLIFILFIVVDTLYAQGNELRIRMGAELETDITERLGVEVNPEIRLQSKNELEESLIELGVKYELFKYLGIAARYRVSSLPDNNNLQHRFAFDVKPNISISNLKIKYRLRFTNYTDFDIQTENKSGYIRNKLICQYDFNDFPLTPYVSAELFYRKEQNDFNKSRYGVGILQKLNKKTDIDVYYLYQKKHKKEKYSHIIGVAFKIEI